MDMACRVPALSAATFAPAAASAVPARATSFAVRVTVVTKAGSHAAAASGASAERNAAALPLARP